MANKHEWIRGEIAAWEREGVVGSGVADSLRARYPLTERASRSALLIGLAVLGALLVGGGIVLLLAHNWADLSRPVRVMIALLPMLVAQALTLFGVARGRDGAGWREGVAVLWTLSIGCAIAMVSQIYHISGSYDSFVLTWVLLTLPVIYLLRSSVAAILYVLGVTAWAFPLAGNEPRVWLYWPLALAVVPLLWRGSVSGVFTSGLALLRWVLTASLFIGVGATLEDRLEHSGLLAYSGLLSILFLLDARLQKDAPSLWHRPMRLFGVAGFLFVSILLTYRWGWMHGLRLPFGGSLWSFGNDFISALLFGAGAVVTGMLVSFRKQLRPVDYFPGALFLFTLAGYLLLTAQVPVLALQIVANGLLAGFGILLLVRGFRRTSLSAVNLGMLVLALLIVLRFFDSEAAILSRAILFIVLGSALLGVNVVLSRKFRRAL